MASGYSTETGDVVSRSSFSRLGGLHSDCWEYQMAYLVDKGFHCIAYDRRGRGGSDEPVAGYEFDTLADDLKAVIAHLDLQAITLVGHSMGCGENVRHLTRHKSGRVARVVMVAPITPVQRVSGEPYAQYVTEHILKPLRMTHTTCAQPPPDTPGAFIAKAYALASEKEKPFEFISPESAPDGGMSVTATDMSHFMIAHLENGEYEGKRILRESTAQSMRMRQFTTDPSY
jgi:pimeloyl-ACP methyl ester carboxylesterase